MYNSDGYGIPILTDFSCACHISNLEILTLSFQERLSLSDHLPSDVVKGKVAPSFKSDIYSLGCLLSKMATKLHNDEVKHDVEFINKIVTVLVNSSSGKLPEILFEFFLYVHSSCSLIFISLNISAMKTVSPSSFSS